MTHEQPTPAPVEVTLKPCPFCGSAAKIIAPLGYGNVRASECSNADCAATGPWSANEAEAIAAWNTRHSAPAGEVEPVACVECGGGGAVLEMDRMVSCFECRGSGEMPVSHPAPPADLVELVEAVKASIEGWNNVVEMDLLPPQHHDTARALSERLRAALAKHGGA